MSAEKTVVKFWMVPEKVEKWIEEMESQGWNLQKISFGAMKFTFSKGQPRQIRYCADFQEKADAGYKSIFQDAGWNLFYSGSGWYIWSMPYKGERPEIYSDFDSLVGRNKRMIVTMVAVFVPFISLFVINIGRIHYISPFGIGLVSVYLIMVAIIVAMVIRLVLANIRLNGNNSKR